MTHEDLARAMAAEEGELKRGTITWEDLPETVRDSWLHKAAMVLARVPKLQNETDFEVRLASALFDRYEWGSPGDETDYRAEANIIAAGIRGAPVPNQYEKFPIREESEEMAGAANRAFAQVRRLRQRANFHLTTPIHFDGVTDDSPFAHYRYRELGYRDALRWLLGETESYADFDYAAPQEPE